MILRTISRTFGRAAALADTDGRIQRPDASGWDISEKKKGWFEFIWR